MTSGIAALSLAGRRKTADALAMLTAATDARMSDVRADYQWWDAMGIWAAVPIVLRLTGATTESLAGPAGVIEGLLLPFRGWFPTAQIDILIPIDVNLGFCALSAGRVDDAIAYFESGVALCERTGVLYHSAHAKVMLGWALAEAHGRSARRRVLELVDAAEAWAAAHGTNHFMGRNFVARKLVSE